jgi:PAS domain S-box-containing protein
MRATLVNAQPGSAAGLKWWELCEDVLCVLDDDLVVRAANPAWSRLLGRAPREVVGARALECAHRDDTAAMLDALSLARERDRFGSVECRLRDAAGRWRRLVWSGVRIDGEWHCSGRDLTAVRSRALHADALVRALRDGFCMVDGDGRIIEVSEAFCEMVGMRAEELVGCAPPFAFWPEEGRDDHREDFALALTGVTQRFDVVFRRSSGERFPVTLDASPVETCDGAPGYICVVRDMTNDLRERERLREAQRLSGLGSFEVEHSGEIAWSPELSRLLGIGASGPHSTLDELLAVLPDADRAMAGAHAAATIVDGRLRTFEHGYLRGGEVRCAEMRLERLGSRALRGTIQDITERKQAQREIDLQSHLLDAVDVAVIATDLNGVVTHWNRGAERVHGWSEAETLGRSVLEFAVGDDDRELVGRLLRAVRERGEWDGEMSIRRRDGSSFPAYTRIALVVDADGEPAGVAGVSVDLSERIEIERELRTTRDYLRAVTDNMGEGLFTLDIDGRLTYMNRAAEELLGWSHEELIGRVMHDVTHHRRADGSAFPLEECPLLAARQEGRILRVDDDVFIRRDDSPVHVSYTAAPFDAGDGVRGSVVVFGDISQHKAEQLRLLEQMERLSWVGRVRDALSEDRLVLHAQPIVDLGTGRVVQHELLIRMRDRDGGLVMPGRFLPAAEEYGLIVDIDRWVVSRAAELAGCGHPVELNLSARSIAAPGLVEHFRSELARTGAEARLLVIELTETALLDDGPAAEAFIHGVKALGCLLALDDFGTGYGGFTYLKRLPVDYLKIDIEFVRDLVTNEASQHVVRALVSLARGFGQLTVAEGAEDEATLQLLRDLGVDYVQGYGVARPGPLQEVLGEPCRRG